MTKISVEKTYSLLEKLTSYIMNEVPKKSELDKLSDYVMNELPTRKEVDGKIDKLAEYVMNEVALKNEVPTKHDFNVAINAIQTALDLKADKKDVDEIKHDLQIIMNGMDKQAQQLDIIRTGQTAFNHAFGRIEKRVEKLEQTH